MSSKFTLSVGIRKLTYHFFISTASTNRNSIIFILFYISMLYLDIPGSGRNTMFGTLYAIWVCTTYCSGCDFDHPGKHEWVIKEKKAWIPP